MAEEIIRLQEVAYQKGSKLYPNADPHILLAHAWLSRMAARGLVDPDSFAAQQQAFITTWQFSTLFWPVSTRALGLHFVGEERPDITKGFPEYGREYDSILMPCLRSLQDGTFFAKYEEINPNMEYSPSKDTGTEWIFKSDPNSHQKDKGYDTNENEVAIHEHTKSESANINTEAIYPVNQANEYKISKGISSRDGDNLIKRDMDMFKAKESKITQNKNNSNENESRDNDFLKTRIKSRK
ncbi:hypothetical protein [Methylotenera sp.]|uniref:hypothetical protein n=1 Tax=Methylotenera sp. TaxID=2051956 RepID=UPI0025F0250B|nr:hypothetical protein [Methylotenera sp.]